MSETTVSVGSADEASSTPVDLNISDIQNALRVIDFACDQGAFKGWDTIGQVAQVRGRLVNFLRAVAPEPSPEADKAEGEATPTA